MLNSSNKMPPAPEKSRFGQLPQIFRDAWWTALAILIVPGLAFWLVDLFWFTDRAIFNIDYLLVCLLLICFGAGAVAVGIAAIVVLDLVFSLAPAYHFSLGTVIDSLQDIASLAPGFLAWEASKMLLLVSVCAAVSYVFLKKARNPKIIAASCVILLAIICLLDFRLSANVLAGNQVFSVSTNIAASSLNNLRLALATSNAGSGKQVIGAADAASEHLQSADQADAFSTIILIVVESLGQLRDPQLNRFQLQALASLQDQPGVSVRQGLVEFHGSTVPAELRELCGIKLLAVHPSPDILPADNCLPKQLHEAGYTTTAIHGFMGTLFSRSRWYPALQFDRIWFAPALEQEISGASRCGIAFHGICDEDVWKLIVAQQGAATQMPQFIYWLTLSAHLPVPHPGGSGSAECAAQEDLLRYPELCNLLLQHRLLFSTIAESVRTGALGRTRILLVGDHTPPFLNSQVRDLFNPGQVPYIDIQIPGAPH